MVTSNTFRLRRRVPILLQGGNAFDAAVPTAAATSVVDPFNSSLGGNGFATVYVAKSREVRTLNFFGTAPTASRPELFTHETLNQGILSSPVPSNLEGYRALIEAHGTMELARVLEPAIELAEDGFRNQIFHEQIASNREIFAHIHDVRCSFERRSRVGSIFRQPDCRTPPSGRTGAGFYEGELARRIAVFFAKEGGILTERDLESYQAKWVEPISISYRGHTIVSQPPNSSAVALLEELNIMEGFDAKALGHNTTPYLHRFMEAVRLSLADRNHFVADTDAVPVPLRALLSKEYAARQRARIEPERASVAMSPGELVSEPDGDTTHLTVMDAEGNAVALTQTLGAGFGSKLVVGDTGLFFSNQMRHMHLEPGSPSKVRGGMRPRSNQSPTIVLRDGEPVMAVGSPGNDGIWQRLAQVIVNVLDFGMTIQTPSPPRFSYGGPRGRT
jgi:gamma-glutamyltranspeptidase/glutathione hydrolase